MTSSPKATHRRSRTAAEAASISRTTAYRYFPNQRALLAAAHPETAAESLLPDDPPDDVAARLDLVVAAFTRMIVDTEAQQRTMLRLSLEAGAPERAQLPLRQGRAIKWIEEALSPLQPALSDSEVHRLAIAIRSATGIEALVWLTDIAGLTRDDATRPHAVVRSSPPRRRPRRIAQRRMTVRHGPEHSHLHCDR